MRYRICNIILTISIYNRLYTLTHKWDSIYLCGHLRGHDGTTLSTIFATPFVFPQYLCCMIRLGFLAQCPDIPLVGLDMYPTKWTFLYKIYKIFKFGTKAYTK